MSKKISISKAIGEALHEEMLRDPKVIIMGEDMGKMGNVFGITVGFQEEFGENRVIDTPISESGFCGMAVDVYKRQCQESQIFPVWKVWYQVGRCHFGYGF